MLARYQPVEESKSRAVALEWFPGNGVLCSILDNRFTSKTAGKTMYI